MKKYKDVLIMAAGIVLLAAGFCALFLIPEPQGTMKALPFLGIGIGCGLFGQGLGNLGSRLAIKKHPELEKQIQIEQNDERNIMLVNRAKAKGHTVMSYLLAALLLVYAWLGVSWKVLLPLVGAYLFVQLYVLYYWIKMTKEQ